LTERQKEQRFHNYQIANLKAGDVKPLIKERFHPVLKEHGFSRASDSLSFRVAQPHYVHYLRLDFSAVYQGRFYVRAGIALDFLPLSDWSAFNAKRVSLDTDCLFCKDVTLPNGNPEFDNGTKLDEANETIDRLIASFRGFDRDYFQQFTHFPEPLDVLNSKFVRRMSESIEQELTPKFGIWGATVEMFTLRLALIHSFIGNASLKRELIEYGLANYELFDLKRRYEELLRDLRRGSGRKS
jgi:hypothetical protein